MRKIAVFFALLAVLTFAAAGCAAEPSPEVTYRLSSPQVPNWVMNVRISRDLPNHVVLTHMPSEVRELRVQRTNAQNADNQFCESFGVAKTLAANVKSDTETGGYVFNFPEEVGRGEVYAANIVVDFCGVKPRRVYYLGFWFGPDAGFTEAVKLLWAKPATVLQVALP